MMHSDKKITRDNAKDIIKQFAIIDKHIVWYGSMKLLSRVKVDDNLIRVESKDAAQELMEITFG